MFDSNEMDAKIGSFIARVACAVLGLCGMVSIGRRLVAWVGGDARFPTIWLALAGERTYHWRRIWGLSCGEYWSISPSGVIPALFNVALPILLVAAAAFHRPWIYVLLLVVFFYYGHP